VKLYNLSKMNGFESLEKDYRDLVESDMPFLKKYPDFTVGSAKKFGKGKPITVLCKNSFLVTNLGQFV